MKTKHYCSHALLGTALISLLFSMPVLAADEESSSGATEQPISTPASAANALTICKELSGDARLECLRDHRAIDQQNPDSAATPAPPSMNADCSQMSDSEKEACEKVARDNAG